MTTFNRTSLYYKHLISAMYLSAFEMIIRGTLRQYSDSLESMGVLIIQGWIYIVPLILWLGAPLKHLRLNKIFKLLVLVQVIYLVLAIAPQNIVVGTYGLLLKGIKSFYIPLIIYYGIFSYLATHVENFEHKFLSHIVTLGVMFGVFIVIEVVSLYFYQSSPFLIYIRQISVNFQDLGRLETDIRPVGLYLGHHVSALFFSLISVICYSLKHTFHGIKYKHLSYFFLLCLFLTTTRTYIIAFSVYYVLVVLLSFDISRYLQALAMAGFLAVFLFVINPSLADFLRSGILSENRSTERMMDKFEEFDWFVEKSVMPNGFMPQDLGEKEGVDVDPIYQDSEVSAYKFAYQTGIVGFLMYLFTVFRPLFTLRIRRMLLNPYSALFFVSAFGWVHYLHMFPIFIFSIMIFAYTMLYQKEKQPGYAKNSGGLHQ